MVDHVCKSYRQGGKSIAVLNDVHLQVEAGTSTAIMGKSGSGKSTLLSLLSGILKPDRGRIELNGHVYGDLDETRLADLRSSHIGFVFQNFQLVSYLNALENVLLPLRVTGRTGADDRAAATLLERVGLGHRLDHLPHQLSGGEKQRVALARALVHQPQLILADEPSGNLDDETGEDIMNLMFELLAQTRASLILVTHSLAIARRCDRLLLLQKGRLVADHP